MNNWLKRLFPLLIIFTLVTSNVYASGSGVIVADLMDEDVPVASDVREAEETLSDNSGSSDSVTSGDEESPSDDGAGADASDSPDNSEEGTDPQGGDEENTEDPSDEPGTGDGEEEPPEEKPEIKMESLSIPSSVIIKASTPVTLAAEVTPEDTTDHITWESSDPSVLTVDEDGVMTGLHRGTVTVTASCGELVSRCQVTIRFADVDESAYYYNDVLWAVETDTTKGVSDILFAPEQTCTRAQLVTFLWRYNGSPAPSSGTTSFTDISASDYFYQAVLWAYQNEIVAGVSSTSFAPEKTCTRGEAITFFWRCQRIRPSQASGFTDVQMTDFYYYPVRWAVQYGITNGVSATSFAPANPVTRAQVVRFLHLSSATNSSLLNRSLWQIIYPSAEVVLDQVGHSLRAAFNWSAGMKYYGHNKYMPDTAAPGIKWYADYGFTNHKGNCYVMASTFYEMAVNLGYQPRQMSGKVPLRRGGLGPHSWVEITINGTNYVFDPNFTNETGRNGYMIHYGQSGTWRYQSYSAMHL